MSVFFHCEICCKTSICCKSSRLFGLCQALFARISSRPNRDQFHALQLAAGGVDVQAAGLAQETWQRDCCGCTVWFRTRSRGACTDRQRCGFCGRCARGTWLSPSRSGRGLCAAACITPTRDWEWTRAWPGANISSPRRWSGCCGRRGGSALPTHGRLMWTSQKPTSSWPGPL